MQTRYVMNKRAKIEISTGALLFAFLNLSLDFAFLSGITTDLKDLVKNLTVEDTPIPPIILTAGAKTKSKRTITLAK